MEDRLRWKCRDHTLKRGTCQDKGSAVRYVKAHILRIQIRKELEDCDNLTCLLFRRTVPISLLFPPLID